MKRIALLVLLVPAVALAEVTLGIAKAPWGHAAIYDSPCTNPSVLKMLPSGARTLFKRAHVVHDGKDYAACWAEVSPGVVYLIDESGDQGAVPAVAFIKPTST